MPLLAIQAPALAADAKQIDVLSRSFRIQGSMPGRGISCAGAPASRAPIYRLFGDDEIDPALAERAGAFCRAVDDGLFMHIEAGIDQNRHAAAHLVRR